MNGPSCQDKKHEKLHFVLIFRFGGNGPGIQCRKNQYKNGPFYHEQKEDNEELFRKHNRGFNCTFLLSVAMNERNLNSYQLRKILFCPTTTKTLDSATLNVREHLIGL